MVRVNKRAQILCALAGPAAGIVFGIGLWPIMHFFPPLHPALTAQQVAEVYRDNSTNIIVGAMFLALAGALQLAFSGPLAVQMRRMEGGESSPLTYTMIMQSVMGLMPFLITAIFFSAAAYRPERSAETIQMLSDIAFFFLIMPAFTGFMQVLVTGAAILGQPRTDIIIPRWVGFLNLWVGVLWLPGAVIALFKSGPFAWNGLLAFWVVVFAYGTWLNVMAWALIKAARNQTEQQGLRAAAVAS